MDEEYKVELKVLTNLLQELGSSVLVLHKIFCNNIRVTCLFRHLVFHIQKEHVEIDFQFVSDEFDRRKF